jgi:hypothetical protein
MKKRFLKKNVKRDLILKKKRKCFNCGKEKYFAKKYRLSKINYAKIDNSKKNENERFKKNPN